MGDYQEIVIIPFAIWLIVGSVVLLVIINAPWRNLLKDKQRVGVQIDHVEHVHIHQDAEAVCGRAQLPKSCNR